MDQQAVQREFCGSTIPPDRPMCPTCRAPRPVAREPELSVTDPVATDPTAPVVAHPPPTPAQAPPPRQVATRGQHIERIEHHATSRWQKGATTLGPVTKVIITIAVLAVLAFTYFLMRGLGTKVIALMILFIPVGALILFFVWRKDQIAEDP